MSVFAIVMVILVVVLIILVIVIPSTLSSNTSSSTPEQSLTTITKSIKLSLNSSYFVFPSAGKIDALSIDGVVINLNNLQPTNTPLTSTSVDLMQSFQVDLPTQSQVLYFTSNSNTYKISSFDNGVMEITLIGSNKVTSQIKFGNVNFVTTPVTFGINVANSTLDSSTNSIFQFLPLQTAIPLVISISDNLQIGSLDATSDTMYSIGYLTPLLDGSYTSTYSINVGDFSPKGVIVNIKVSSDGKYVLINGSRSPTYEKLDSNLPLKMTQYTYNLVNGDTNYGAQYLFAFPLGTVFESIGTIPISGFNETTTSLIRDQIDGLQSSLLRNFKFSANSIFFTAAESSISWTYYGFEYESNVFLLVFNNQESSVASNITMVVSAQTPYLSGTNVIADLFANISNDSVQQSYSSTSNSLQTFAIDITKSGSVYTISGIDPSVIVTVDVNVASTPLTQTITLAGNPGYAIVSTSTDLINSSLVVDMTTSIAYFTATNIISSFPLSF